MVAVSQVDLVIKALGGPTKASWELSKLIGRPVSYASVQAWRRRPSGIPLHMRSLMLRDADVLGLKDNPPVLEYLQPK